MVINYTNLSCNMPKESDPGWDYKLIMAKGKHTQKDGSCTSVQLVRNQSLCSSCPNLAEAPFHPRLRLGKVELPQKASAVPSHLLVCALPNSTCRGSTPDRRLGPLCCPNSAARSSCPEGCPHPPPSHPFSVTDLSNKRDVLLVFQCSKCPFLQEQYMLKQKVYKM